MIRITNSLSNFATVFRNSDANFGVYRYDDNTTMTYGHGPVKLTIYCAMDFFMYPLDTHR